MVIVDMAKNGLSLLETCVKYRITKRATTGAGRKKYDNRGESKGKTKTIGMKRKEKERKRRKLQTEDSKGRAGIHKGSSNGRDTGVWERRTCIEQRTLLKTGAYHSRQIGTGKSNGSHRGIKAGMSAQSTTPRGKDGTEQLLLLQEETVGNPWQIWKSQRRDMRYLWILL